MELQFELELEMEDVVIIEVDSEPLIPNNIESEESKMLNSLYDSNLESDEETETDSDYFSLTSETQIGDAVNFMDQQESKKRKMENTVQTEPKVSKKTRML